MGESAEEEVVAPLSVEYFVAYTKTARGCLQDVDGDLAEGDEVFGRMTAPTLSVPSLGMMWRSM
jgi:hypothetical protein